MAIRTKRDRAILGMIAAVLAGALFAACGTAPVQDAAPPRVFTAADGIFMHQVGNVEVFMLVENEFEGNPGILLEADEELLANYIPEGFTMTVNAFLVRTPEFNIMIDAGTGNNGNILERLQTLGLGPDMIDFVLITHLHGDHFGGLRIGGLQDAGGAAFPNASVLVAARDLEYFTQTNPNQMAVDILELYMSRLDTFEPAALGAEPYLVVPNVAAVANFGHTPGHTVFIVEDAGARLIIGGDFLHVGDVQFANPDISATFDVDPIEAAASRRQILEYAAANNIPLGGMHILHPGIGMVETDGTGFRFVPVQ
ncbi:MAG: MBL fold metallo-hydrolase [Spirochaetes bacterium]|nr:MBL fold metallo-hydrolase [Spirochaetota bacterium]